MASVDECLSGAQIRAAIVVIEQRQMTKMAEVFKINRDGVNIR